MTEKVGKVWESVGKEGMDEEKYTKSQTVWGKNRYLRERRK